MRLFGSRPFIAAVLVGIFVNGAYAAPVLSLSDYLQYVRQDSVLVATSDCSRSTSSAPPPGSWQGGA